MRSSDVDEPAAPLRLITRPEREAADEEERHARDRGEVADVLAQASAFAAEHPTRGVMVVLVHDDGTHSHLGHAGHDQVHPLVGAIAIATRRLLRSIDED